MQSSSSHSSNSTLSCMKISVPIVSSSAEIVVLLHKISPLERKNLLINSNPNSTTTDTLLPVRRHEDLCPRWPPPAICACISLTLSNRVAMASATLNRGCGPHCPIEIVSCMEAGFQSYVPGPRKSRTRLTGCKAQQRGSY